MACLFVGKDARKDGTQRIEEGLVSFGWISAATCLQKLDELSVRGSCLDIDVVGLIYTGDDGRVLIYEFLSLSS